jgi:hypothetical protein
MPVMEKEKTHSTSRPDRVHPQLREEGGLDSTQLSPTHVGRTQAVLREVLQEGIRWGRLASPPLNIPQLAPRNFVDIVRPIERECRLVQVGRKVNA